MGRAYAEALRACGHDPSVRAIVVTGAGKGFCAGADLGVLAQGPEALEAFLAEQRRDSPTLALDLPVPVVTAVQGAAAGLGFVIAVAADVTFLGARARLIPAFPRLGLIAEYGIASLLLARIGHTRTSDLLLSGRELDATEAQEWGLGTGPVDDPLAAALDWAQTVAAQCSPTSVATIKGQIARAAQQPRDLALAESLDLMSESFRGPDLPEALRARAEGRAPDFGKRR
jgi:enoyl-CoA hydratase/carnithine racemase